MTNKHKSIFKVMIDTVSKLPLFKGVRSPVHKNMKPGKDFNKPVSNHAFDYMKELNDEEFEKLIAMIFKQRGYAVSEKRSKDDYSVDVVLSMNNETTLVQYMHWREHHVDVGAINDLYSAMDDESAHHGIVITSGIFTPEALDFALGKALMLINGIDLSQMIEVLSASKAEHNTSFEKQIEESIEEKKNEMPEIEPLCPICSSMMVKRTAKKGKNAGNTFWGCSQFPNCRGVEKVH
ncbi:MAG: restriction endonuclease [Gammaproteobacteria bacterium]|nr:restriction endonuclease [Gammaproteobacteria bacterium]MCW9031834.1 restriction endonuclease [Gammaproteobacteria bacterium]